MGRVKLSLPMLLWPALAVSLALAAWQLAQWQQARRWNREVADASLLQRSPLPDAPALHYAAGWLEEQAGRGREALHRYAEVEHADDPHLAARAKFAMGNLYLQIALGAADVAAGGSHVRGLAQAELAREAYRDALRLDPELRAARYNLELLERLSPDKRVEGWSRRERNQELGVASEPGWASLQQSELRGLP